eukprot:5406748-Pyramimonas_sp.AAC.1
MQHDITTHEATLTAHAANAQIHHRAPPPDYRKDRVSTCAHGDIRTGPTRRASPGAASAAAATQTRHVSPARPPSPTLPVPTQTLSHLSLPSATPIEDSDTARMPQLPRITQI